MRTAKIEIGGREYLLCFSARVVRAVTERYGGVEYIDSALSGRPQRGDAAPEAVDGQNPAAESAFDAVRALDEAVWLLSAMMDGGARYAKLNDLDNPPVLTADDLLDVLDLSDFSRLKSKIAETITNGERRNVEATPPKNAKTTQADS